MPVLCNLARQNAAMGTGRMMFPPYGSGQIISCFLKNLSRRKAFAICLDKPPQFASASRATVPGYVRRALPAENASGDDVDLTRLPVMTPVGRTTLTTPDHL